MGLALEVAAETPPGDVPVGAIIVNAQEKVIAAATNRREADGDPTAHAEVLAIREAVAVHGDNWRLEDCTVVVTLEPCAMCAGAIANARVGTVIFGSYEPKTGAVGSVIDVLRQPGMLHTPEVLGGVRDAECAALLTTFFAGMRRR